MLYREPGGSVAERRMPSWMLTLNVCLGSRGKYSSQIGRRASIASSIRIPALGLLNLLCSLPFQGGHVAGRTPREAADNFASFLDETISCITAETLTAFQQSDRLYRVFSHPPFSLNTRSGARIFLSITQVFSVGLSADDKTQFKGKTRFYSYRLSQQADVGAKEVLAYHWHPLESDVRHPHLHVACVPRVHFPTSRVCLEDVIEMLIRYYGVRPRLLHDEWTGILNKNKSAFEQMATWKIRHPK